MRTAGELAEIIKQEVKMDIAELGSSESVQNGYIFAFMSLALQEWARLAYLVTVSDPLMISGDGYVVFQKSSQPIQDLYEPLRLMKSNGYPEKQRVNFAGDQGWFRESSNSEIHVRNISGEYTLYYLRRPAWIDSESDVPEWPASGYLALIFKVCGMIKESKNYYEEAEAMYARAERHLPAVVMANLSAIGTTDGQPLSYTDYDTLKGG